MVAPYNPQKKRKMVSKERLSEELLQLFSEIYPTKEDEENNIIRIDRPDGTFICCVPLETEDTSYLVKLKLQIDKNPEESLEREEEYSGDDSQGEVIQGAEQIADTEDEDSEE